MNSPHKFSERSTSETSLHIEGINTLASAVKTGRHEIEDQNTVSESLLQGLLPKVKQLVHSQNLIGFTAF